VIDHERHLVRIPLVPAKADAPLVVDANAMLSGAIAFQLLESVAGRHAQIVQCLCGVHDHQLAQHGTLKPARETTHRLAAKEPFRIPVPEALDHPTI
jgi:hypothetical protein